MTDLHRNVSPPIGQVNIGSHRIARSFAMVLQLDDTILANARSAVSDYVGVQRFLDTPPESIIAHVKGIALRSCPPDAPFEVRQALLRRVVEWCIETYYGQSPHRVTDGPDESPRADS